MGGPASLHAIPLSALPALPLLILMRGQGVAAHHKGPLKEPRCWSGPAVHSSELLVALEQTHLLPRLTPPEVPHHAAFAVKTVSRLGITISSLCGLIKENGVVQSSCYIIKNIMSPCPLASESFFGPRGGDEMEGTTQRAFHRNLVN